MRSCRTWTPSRSSSATRAQNTSGTRTTFFVTGAFQSEEMEQELLDNGFSFFFVKPFDESVLVSRVFKAAGNSSRPQQTPRIPTR